MTEKRKVSLGLGVGIVFIPLVFAWFTLRKGYSKVVKGLAFGWLVLSLIITSAGAGGSGTKQRETGINSEGSSLSRPPIVPSKPKPKKEKKEKKVAKKRAEKIYSIGERFKLGGFAYRILDVTVTRYIGNRFYGERAGENGVFYVIHFEIENLQGATDTVITDDFKIIDARFIEYSPSSAATTALAMSGKKDMFTQLQPGIRKKSMTAFELPLISAVADLKLIVPRKGFSIQKVKVQLPSVSLEQKKKKRKKRGRKK